VKKEYNACEPVKINIPPRPIIFHYSRQCNRRLKKIHRYSTPFPYFCSNKLQMTKAALRDIYKAKRAALTEAEIERMDDLLLIQFQRLVLPPLQYVHTYLAITGKQEIDTHYLLQYLKFRNPGMVLVIPKMDAASGELVHCYYDEHTELVQNKWGIYEPLNVLPVDIELIDLVFVPLLAVDTEGHRVGYGKGFYDRFLPKLRTDALTVGLSYFDPVNKIEDTGQFDIPLQVCITPQDLYEF
jgi:5-formyltetrahydrofolate cyclo-ligase